jgi:hypothetical protein
MRTTLLIIATVACLSSCAVEDGSTDPLGQAEQMVEDDGADWTYDSAAYDVGYNTWDAVYADVTRPLCTDGYGSDCGPVGPYYYMAPQEAESIKVFSSLTSIARMSPVVRIPPELDMGTSRVPNTLLLRCKVVRGCSNDYHTACKLFGFICISSRGCVNHPPNDPCGVVPAM